MLSQVGNCKVILLAKTAYFLKKQTNFVRFRKFNSRKLEFCMHIYDMHSDLYKNTPA